MGRGKIEIKRIENSSNRQVTYSKRRNGILKKAKEITVLCDAKVSLIIFGSSGKMYDFVSSSTTLPDMLDTYQKATGKKLWDPKHEELNNEIDRIKKENDSMQIELRHLKGEDIQSLNHKELMALEDALEKGLTTIRDKQMEYLRAVKKNDQMLEEENKELLYEWQQREVGVVGGGGGGVGNSSRSDVMRAAADHHHHHHQMQQQIAAAAAYHHHQQQQQQMPPFAFRVQPMQPNLHHHSHSHRI